MSAEEDFTFPEGEPNYEKPKVFLDGKEVERTDAIDKLQGKTLEVYNFLISNPGNHGVREIQRSLKYSSPSLVVYHLNHLVEAGIVTKDVDNRYLILTDREKLGSFTHHIRVMEYWIPRSFVYGITTLFLVLSGLVLVFLRVNSHIIWGWVFLPVLTLLTFVLFYDGYRLSKRLIDSANTNE